MAIWHKIRSKEVGNHVCILLTAKKAIMEYCKECLGWEDPPKECKNKLCALWPFRTYEKPKDTITKSEMKEFTNGGD